MLDRAIQGEIMSTEEDRSEVVGGSQLNRQLAASIIDECGGAQNVHVQSAESWGFQADFYGGHHDCGGLQTVRTALSRGATVCEGSGRSLEGCTGRQRVGPSGTY